MPSAVAAQLPAWLFELLGWIPALVFPAASGVQLLAIIHRRHAEGVSIPAWVLFAIANVCLFGYTEKYTEWESILGSLGSAVLNVCIVIAAIRYRTARQPAGARNPAGGNAKGPDAVDGPPPGGGAGH